MSSVDSLVSTCTRRRDPLVPIDVIVFRSKPRAQQTLKRLAHRLDSPFIDAFLRLQLGNGTQTTYEYDAGTFRLRRVHTTRSADDLQDLRYTHDAVGTVVEVRDFAQQTAYVDSGGNWTGTYDYAQNGNRLLETSSPAGQLSYPTTFTAT